MATQRKPDKFPLRLHKTGQWTKRVRGRQYYFGTDRDAALKEYVRVRDDIEAGRKPRPKSDGGITVADLANRFLTAKRRKVDAGEMSGRMWSEYHRGCESVVAEFGSRRLVDHLTPEDFGQLRARHAKLVGTYSVAKLVQVTKTLFKFAFDEGLIDRPVRYGDQFGKPPARVMRNEKASRPAKLIDAETARILIDAAPVQLRAMILLGLNAGLGQSDCAQLPRSAIVGQWLDFPRPKTGIGRRAFLWPETVAALDAVHAIRPKPIDPENDRLVFLTKYGLPWVKYVDGGLTKRGTQNDSVSREFKKLVESAGVTVPGGPYIFRSTFRTVADETLDEVAIDYVMGHADPSMGAVYRQRIDDARLVAVAEHLHRWLYGPAGTVPRAEHDPKREKPVNSPLNNPLNNLVFSLFKLPSDRNRQQSGWRP